MTPDLHVFADRLREFIAQSAAAGFSEIAPDQFNALALQLFALQFAGNEPYRRLCVARRCTPGDVDQWTHIPAVPTAAFKELELTSLAPAERTNVFHSSGTTGQQASRHFHNAESLTLYEASLWPWFRRHVLAGLEGQNWRLLLLTPPPVAAPHSSLVHMFQTIRRRSGTAEASYFGSVDAEGAWTLDVAGVMAALDEAMAMAEPVCLLGTAFNFIHLLDGLAARGHRAVLPPGSVVMETGGYKGRSRELPKAELHALIERILGVPAANIVCEYGMSELSSQAYDRVAGDGWRVPESPVASRHFRFPPWCRVQIVSPETGREVAEGETGLVRVFDLANVFSVAAIQTEDLAVRRGTGFELLGRAALAEPRGCSLQTA